MMTIRRAAAVVFFTGCLAMPLLAEDTVSTALSPGSYVINIVPTINDDMGKRIEKSLTQLPGLKDVTSKTDDSSIHFTVKEKTQVNLVDIQKNLQSIDKGAVMTTPILAHTMSSNPGL